MGLEAATWLEDLNTANPAGGDNVSQGDNHIRLVKTVLQNQFTSLGAAAVTVTAAEINDVPNKVNSVFGRSPTEGAIVAVEGDYDIDELGGVDMTTNAPVSGDVMEYDGTNWVPVDRDTHHDTFSTTGTTEIGETTTIPADAYKIELLIHDVSLTGAGSVYLELGDASGYAVLGEGCTFWVAHDNQGSSDWASAGVAKLFGVGAGSTWRSGIVTLYRRSASDKWIISGSTADSNSGAVGQAETTSGYINNDGTDVTELRVTCSAGDTFDAGAVDVRISCNAP